MVQIKPLGDPYKDKNTGKKWIDVSISEDALMRVKSSVEFYKGDADDPLNVKNMEEIRHDVHEIFKILRPS